MSKVSKTTWVAKKLKTLAHTVDACNEAYKYLYHKGLHFLLGSLAPCLVRTSL